MAQIDLKYAVILVSDGYSRPGAVNNSAGYTTGATTMTVDTFLGAVAVGDTFKVVGSTATHTVTAHTETTGNTTSITFTPGVTGAVVDNAVITILPHSLEINIGNGNLTYSEKRNIDYVLNRGRLDQTRLGDEAPVEVSLDFIWEHITSAVGSPPTIEECFKQKGGAANWVSSATDQCQPYAVDLQVQYVPPCSGEEPETIILQDFRWESGDHDFKAASVSMKGKCNVTEAIATRIAS